MKSTSNRWLTYLNERSPLAPLAFIAAGISLSGPLLISRFNTLHTVIGIVGTLGVLIQLRLGDELKDFEKDKIVHPDRPLPRGLFQPHELERALRGVLAFLLLLAVFSAFVGFWWGGAGLALSSIFGWLMYHEFFVGQKLNCMPMAYAFSHQVIVFPLYGWPAGLIADQLTTEQLRLYLIYLVANFGASMSFEMARKLDPHAHRLQQTYLNFYGPRRTALLIAGFVGLSIVAGQQLPTEMARVLPWFQIPFALSLLWIVSAPQKFKSIEGLAVLSATAHLWIFGLAPLGTKLIQSLKGLSL